MKKTTVLVNYGEASELQNLGARLEPLELKIMTLGNHSLSVTDGDIMTASGVVNMESEHFNYGVDVKKGEDIEYNGEAFKIDNIIYPHIIGRVAGDVRRINIVELVASKVREMF